MLKKRTKCVFKKGLKVKNELLRDKNLFQKLATSKKKSVNTKMGIKNRLEDKNLCLKKKALNTKTFFKKRRKDKKATKKVFLNKAKTCFKKRPKQKDKNVFQKQAL